MDRDLRKEASRTLAYFIETTGGEWTSLRDAVKSVAVSAGIPYENRRRSAIAADLMTWIKSRGVRVPDSYKPPWSSRLFRKPTRNPSKYEGFYQTWTWRELRYKTLLERGRRCECCGATPDGGAQIVVDHIKPIRKFWELRLAPENLQVLCDDCNKGKGHSDQTDFRVSTGFFLRPD